MQHTKVSFTISNPTIFAQLPNLRMNCIRHTLKILLLLIILCVYLRFEKAYHVHFIYKQLYILLYYQYYFTNCPIIIEQF